MWKKVTLPLEGIFLYLSIWIPLWVITNESVKCSPASAVLVDANPIEVRRVLYNPDRAYKRRRVPEFYMPESHSEYYDDDQESLFSEEDSFFMGPEDAVTEPKYSPPIVNRQPQQPHRHYKDTFSTTPFFTRSQDIPTFIPDRQDKSVIREPISTGNRRFTPIPVTHSVFQEVTVTSDYKVNSNVQSSFDLIERKQRRSDSPIQPHLLQNNFTDVNESHDVVPSDAILQYQPHPVIPNNETPKDKNYGPNVSVIYDALSSTGSGSISSENVIVPVDASVTPEQTLDIPTSYRTEATVDFLDGNSTGRTVYQFENQTYSSSSSVTTQNNSDVLQPVKSTKIMKLSSGIVAAIVIGVLTCVTLLTSSVIYLLYRRYNGKCTGVAEGKFNSDNCGYLDDSLRSSVYLNNHIELPKENSEEMTSLDNDSFLNSLETMTIQNYWADNTKNTKV